MQPLWETTAPFALFMLAVAAAAWLAGTGPALLTGAASIAARLYFDSPVSRSGLAGAYEENVRVALFVAFCIGIVILFERMREDRRELERSIDTARAEIAERRRAEEELARARDAAQEANRLKDEFLALVSHELRTPLNAILGWVSLIRSGALTPARAAHALDIIHRNASAQAQLVSDLLDVARSLTGRLHIDPAPVDLAGIVETAVESIRSTAEARQVALSVVAVEQPLQVWGDADRLTQVVWNLLSNAVKFTPSGGRVVLTARVRETYAELVVEDTGAGIEREFLPHIFDRFSQADTGTTRCNGGVGLGLAIVRHIVELHGGSVVAESAGPLQGARFTVLLPQHVSAHSPEDAAPPAVATVSGRILEGAQVLVVDDDEDCRVMVETTLAAAGAIVSTAASADEAVRIVERTACDVWIIDLAMPDQDGAALLRRLRDLPPQAGGATPAIALTAYAEPRDRARAIQAGFQRHLGKPVTGGALVGEVAALLRPVSV